MYSRAAIIFYLIPLSPYWNRKLQKKWLQKGFGHIGLYLASAMIHQYVKMDLLITYFCTWRWHFKTQEIKNILHVYSYILHFFLSFFTVRGLCHSKNVDDKSWLNQIGTMHNTENWSFYSIEKCVCRIRCNEEGNKHISFECKKGIRSRIVHT